jgi:protein TonB
MARLTRTQGTVVVQAMISRTGSIENAHALSGPAILQPAALAAVRSARYRPYLLNGTPVEVETTISITFHMND